MQRKPTMKKSLKGALLSGLVLPGLGQLWLKHYLRGFILIALVLASLAVNVTKFTQQAYAILEKIESEGGAIDLVAILNSASSPSFASDSFTIKLASVVLILSWIIGTIDAFLLGRKQDLAEQSKEPTAKQRDIPG
jgi:hypothetical protein